MDYLNQSDSKQYLSPRHLWNRFYIAHESNSVWGGPNQVYKRLLKHLPPSPSVLDLGCGDGRHSVFFAEQGAIVVAVDVSDIALQLLSERAEHVLSKISLHRRDIAEFHQFGLFDLTICHGVFNSIEPERWSDTVQHIKSQTNIGGFCSIAVFNHTATNNCPHPYVVADMPRKYLLCAFSDWFIAEHLEYVREHDHDRIGLHRHKIQLLVAKKSKSCVVETRKRIDS